MIDITRDCYDVYTLEVQYKEVQTNLHFPLLLEMLCLVRVHAIGLAQRSPYVSLVMTRYHVTERVHRCTIDPIPHIQNYSCHAVSGTLSSNTRLCKVRRYCI